MGILITSPPDCSLWNTSTMGFTISYRRIFFSLDSFNLFYDDGSGFYFRNVRYSFRLSPFYEWTTFVYFKDITWGRRISFFKEKKNVIKSLVSVHKVEFFSFTWQEFTEFFMYESHWLDTNDRKERWNVPVHWVFPLSYRGLFFWNPPLFFFGFCVK